MGAVAAVGAAAAADAAAPLHTTCISTRTPCADGGGGGGGGSGGGSGGAAASNNMYNEADTMCLTAGVRSNVTILILKFHLFTMAILSDLYLLRV